ncbi:MAG: rhodanese-like domain-containing protein, partial [Porticoccaceae bacterium]|nr:rhodanese-like domain-containing protein [Porticoccaceae bacterium]
KYNQPRKAWLTLALAFIAFTASCSSDVDGVRHINAIQAEQLIENNSGLVILDIRTAKEFIEGHIAGAVNIDYYSDDFRQSLAALDKGKTYLVHCRSGGRSGRSLKLFNELGFEKVIHLDGGIKAWKSEKLPLSE